MESRNWKSGPENRFLKHIIETAIRKQVSENRY
jgi:hypothetical protein